MSNSKLCPRCDQNMGLSYFYTVNGRPSTYCKLCQRSYSNTYRKNNKEKANLSTNAWLKENKEWHFKQKQCSKFGISVEQYNEILLRQDFKCAICSKHRNEFKISFAIDHCHLTGKIRGLLCKNCNLLLGHAKDNPEILHKSIKYLLK